METVQHFVNAFSYLQDQIERIVSTPEKNKRKKKKIKTNAEQKIVLISKPFTIDFASVCLQCVSDNDVNKKIFLCFMVPLNFLSTSCKKFRTFSEYDVH